MALGKGSVTSVAVMWSVTGLTTLFLVLRLYTRLVVLPAFSNDDYVFIIAYISLLLMTCFFTKSATLGLGQSNADIGDIDRITEAVLWASIGETFTVLGTALAKWSLGLFLLRLVIVRWQKIVIWLAMLMVMTASISTLMALWLQFLWDDRIPGGNCPNMILVIPSQVLGYATIVVDFTFAILPWLFIWSLQMNRQEKIVILVSMSLGVFAAACGIVRALDVHGLGSPNALRDSLPLLLWSAIEQSVTMICICVAVCRPVFKITLRGFTSRHSITTTGVSEGTENQRRHLAHGGSGARYSTTKDDCELGMRSVHQSVTLPPEPEEPTVPEPAMTSLSANEGRNEISIQVVDESRRGSGIYVTNEVHITMAR